MNFSFKKLARITTGVALGLVFLAFLFQLGLGWAQIKGTKQLDWLPNSQIEDLYTPGGRSAQFAYNFGWQEPIRLSTRLDGVPAVMRVKLPVYGDDDFVLNGWLASRAEHLRPPRLEIYLNDQKIGDYIHLSYALLRGFFEIRIPRPMMAGSADNYLVIKSFAGGWKGRFLLIPHGFWRDWLPKTIPVTVMLSALFFKRIWLAPVCLVLVLFALYSYTLYPKTLGPMDGVVFDDANDYVWVIDNDVMIFKMQKHVLFFPVLHALYHGIGSLLFHETFFALSFSYVLIGALNGVLVCLWFRRLFVDWLLAWLATIVYIFSFSIWLYSSIYETYIFSSLLVSAALLSRSLAKPDVFWSRYLLPALFVVLAGLAHPPLLLLLGLLVVDLLISQNTVWKKLVQTVSLGLGVIFCFLVSMMTMRYIYHPSPVSRGFDNTTTSFIANVIQRYSAGSEMDWSNFGNVIYGQFVYAFGGFPYGYDWSAGWSGISQYLAMPAGWVFLICFSFLGLLALLGLLRSRAMWRRLLLLLALVLLPHLLFYWYFNPGEMLLYSAPLLAPILATLVRFSSAASGRLAKLAIFAFAISLLVQNINALVSYH